ncbi:MAG: hypothetical protein RBR81_10065 [Bacteroidales bacterium]|jgi:hypothetical protein|nr:hypothetical protein [Bacteroidales bacterium]
MKRYPFFELLTVFLLVIHVTSCRKNYSLDEKQAILFQYEYVNNAMGYQHNGFYIDNEGNVLTYNNPEQWHFPDETLSINEDHVAENLAQCTHSGIKIQNEILEKYSGHIPNIVSSKVTAAKNTGADRGRIQYLCYRYDEHSHCYKGALIKMEGDFTKENLNFYSRKLTMWMKSIVDCLSK